MVGRQALQASGPVDIDDVELAPLAVTLTVEGAAGSRERIGELMRGRDIFAHDLTGIAAIDQRPGQITHAVGLQELEAAERDVDPGDARARRVVEAVIEQLAFVDRFGALDVEPARDQLWQNSFMLSRICSRRAERVPKSIGVPSTGAAVQAPSNTSVAPRGRPQSN